MIGKINYTRKIIGDAGSKELAAEIPFFVVDEDDYINQKSVIDRVADLAIEVVESRLGFPRREPVDESAFDSYEKDFSAGPAETAEERLTERDAGPAAEEVDDAPVLAPFLARFDASLAALPKRVDNPQ